MLQAISQLHLQYFVPCLTQVIKYVLFFKFYFIFKLYITVFVLPNIKMNLPQV